MKHLKIYILLLALPCLALQCNKDKDDPDPDNGNNNNKEQLPPATQSGKNTFGCLVNGEVWRPKDKGFYGSKIDASYGKGALGIGAERLIKNKKGETITDEHIGIAIQKHAYIEKNIH